VLQEDPAGATSRASTPTGPPLVTVVVVTWQGRHLVAPCLRSLRAQTLPHQVLVVDNGSTDGTLELLASEFPEVDVLALPRNTGFAGGVAAALGRVDTRFLALLNNDAEADPAWLATGVARLVAAPGVAAVSSRMLLAGRADTVNNAGVVLLDSGYGADRGLGEADDPRFDFPVAVFAASGGASVYRTLAVKAVGGVEAQFFMYYEDTDLSWRLRLAGWSVEYCPGAVVRHRHAASSRPGSATFAFHTERNRLLTLARCAPLPTAAGATARYALTTASLAVSHLLGRPIPPNAVFSPQVRLRALASATRLAPGLLGVRRSATRGQRVAVLREWRGVPSRPLDPVLEPS